MECDGATGNTSGRANLGSPTTDDVLDRALARIPGMITRPELQFLARLAGESTGTIVNLGVFAGLSTVALCLGASTRSTEVVAVDSFDWSLADGEEERGESDDGVRDLLAGLGSKASTIDVLFRLTPDVVQRNIAEFGFRPRLIKALSWVAADQVNGPVGLCFIDADHTRESVEKDLAAWVPRLSPNAVVVFHDYAPSDWPEVQLVADDWARRDRWVKGERVGQSQAFRRALG